MENWLTKELIKRIREVFEPRYKHPLSDQEVLSIAENLSSLTEVVLKFKWKQKYEKQLI